MMYLASGHFASRYQPSGALLTRKRDGAELRVIHTHTAARPSTGDVLILFSSREKSKRGIERRACLVDR
jgi:hypothetical protein